MAPIFVGSNNENTRIRPDRLGFAASTSDPGSAAEGDGYYNSSDNQLKFYDGSAWSAIQGSGAVELVASGTLSNGSPVVINPGGTVSKVAASNPSIGSSSEFLDKSLGSSAIGYDENTKRVVLAIQHPDSPYRGQVYVGVVTASDNSVHWGSATNLHASGTQQGTPHKVIYDPSSQKSVIIYDSNATGSTKGYAVVGTVAGPGLGITFGTPVVFEDGGQAFDAEAVYDPVNKKLIIVYQDASASGHGRAIVGTVSGDAITFGSTYTFESASSGSPNASYDTNANKILIAYRDTGNSGHGTAIVGTVSGTSISFGTAAVFSSSNSPYTGVAYNPKVGKHLIAYRDNGDSEKGKALMATVSGNTVTFGTTMTFQGSYTSNYNIPIYDSNREKTVILAVTEQGGSPNYENATAYIADIDGNTISIASTTAFNTNRNNTMFDATYDSFQARFVTASRNFIVDQAQNSSAAFVFDPGNNLFPDNFIGFSDAAYSNGQTANIQIISSVDDAQTGLTTGSLHYVQNDGSLSTTAGTPSVEAGTAVSATKIRIKS